MIFQTSLASFIAYFMLLMQPTQEVELIPVDAGVEDRGAHSESLRVTSLDLRQDASFERLYRVAGSDGVYVRKAGGLQAVFKNPVYYDGQTGPIPLIPAGTVYSIGEVRRELLGQLEALSEPSVPEELVIAERYESKSAQSAHITTRPTSRGGVKFLDDEVYRRERLALFVLNIVLAENP